MLKYDDIKGLRSKKAVYGLIESQFQGRTEVFFEALNSSFNDLIRTDLARAGKYLRRAQGILKYLPPHYEGRVPALQARYFQYTGNNREALYKYEQALAINIKYRQFAANARLRKGLMNVYMYLGRYDDALGAGRLALGYFRRAGMKIDSGQVLNNIGNVYHRMDKIKMALWYYNRAEAEFREFGGIPLAIVKFNRANIYSVLNELDTARKLYREAEKIYSAAGNRISLCQIEYSLAIMDYWVGNYTSAFNVLEKTIDRLIELGDMRTAVIAQLDLVELNLELNLFSNAVFVADSIIRRAGEMGMKYEQAKAHYFIARAALHSRDYKKADQELARARQYFGQEKNRLWLAMVDFEKSRLYSAIGDFRKASKLTFISRKQFQSSGDKYRANEAGIFGIEISLRSGRPGRALRAAAGLLKSRLPNTQRQNLYYLIGHCHFQKKNYSTALVWLKKSIRLIEKNLVSMHLDELRFFYIADKYHIYKMIVQCYLNLGRVKTSYLTNLRALRIANSRSSRVIGWQKKIPAELLKERDSLRIALKKIHRSPGEGHRDIPSSGKIFSIEQRLWTIERKIRNASGINNETIDAAEWPVSFAEKLIGKNEALLDFLILGDRVGVFYMTNQAQKYIEFSVSPDELRMEIHKLSFICERSIFGTSDSERAAHDINHILEKIYGYIISPIESQIRTRDLIIILEGEFFQIPFSALRNKEGRYLKEGRNVNLISDPSDLAARNGRINAFGAGNNSVFASGGSHLSSMDIEAREIGAIFSKSKIFMGHEATRNKFLGEAKKTTGFLHIAAHASRSSENPLFSKILLDDGPFFPFDLYWIEMKPKLVTLSGCHTAAPGLYYGDSYSLAKVFYQTGTRFVLGSIWPVSDRVSMYFMVTFYKSLRQDNNIFAAYRDAVEATKKVADNPAHWGSFILLGL